MPLGSPSASFAGGREPRASRGEGPISYRHRAFAPSRVVAMAVVEPSRTYEPTHEVLNQAPPLVGYNVFEQDRALIEAFEREGAGWARDRAREIGEFAGGEAIELGRQANENPPVLRTHDRYGNRIDGVEFHPAWHRLRDFAGSHGPPSLPWTSPRPS